MAILATLRQDRAGDWKSLDDYLRELRHREASALAALANSLSASPAEQRELAEHGEAGAVLLEVACDLRVPKSSRLAATRCLLEAGIEPPFIAHLFIGAGDLITDPRLGSAARRLVESGLPAALQLEGDPAQITLAAGAFARAVHAGASVVGQVRIQELLSGVHELHAGAAAARFALGIAELPEGHKIGWKRLLEQTCAGHRRAPAAAKRMGLAPSWPPNLPDAFAPMIREAEQETSAIEPKDAAASPSALKRSTASTQAGKTQAKGPAARTLGPPIRRSPFRKPIGAVVEVPAAAAPKPMEPVPARSPAAAAAEPRRPKIQTKSEPDDLRFDARGKRIPRNDRWDDDDFGWQGPVLPSSELRPPPRARPASSAFASRLQSIFEDRPEAVDRLCAAAEARAAVGGEEALIRELSAEMSGKSWRDKRLPAEQLRRLQSIAQGPTHPSSWRSAARLMLDFFVSATG
ncbi:MAG: hypothetical protein E6J86_10195 [Deltaproteobacteria bacterium]|nr:MAG: hypothetical protein E6J86_10195 [Deltaproteobacteria bacterium]